MLVTLLSLLLTLAPAVVPAENPPAYLGCLAVPSTGIARPLAFNVMNFQKVPASPALCAGACHFANGGPSGGFNYDYPMFAINSGACCKYFRESCHLAVSSVSDQGFAVCGFHLAPGATLVPDSICDTKCPGNDAASCGGNKVVSLYGDGQFLSTPVYMAGLAFDKCYEFDQSKYDGPRYNDAAKMTVNSCANFCVGHGKYGISLDKDNNCCEFHIPDIAKTAMKNELGGRVTD